MSVAIFIASESEIEGEDVFVDGKSLGSVEPTVLERIAEQAGCPHIYDLISQDPGELAEYLDELDEADLPSLEWYPAAEGLTAVRGLRDHITAHPTSVPNPEAVLTDLNEMERVLNVLDEHAVKFHFEMDF